MRLQEALQRLRPRDREALRQRRSLRLDPRKRLGEVEQMARALVAATDLRQSRFPPESAHLLRRLAASGGILHGGALDPGAALLSELGVAFPRGLLEPEATASSTPAPASDLLLPAAFLVQVPVGEGEDPRSLRACLHLMRAELHSPVVSGVLGRALGVGGALALQELWEHLAAEGRLVADVAALPPGEARLLDAIERVGGEVSTTELLALDQAPGLYRTQSGLAVPRRGAPYMLQRRGMLFQLGVERFVVPTEVSRIVGAARQATRAQRRASIRAGVTEGDHSPRRARYGRDPSLAAAAALAMLRAWEVPLRPGAGVSRTALRRVAERLGEREGHVELWVALARAAGIARVAVPGAGETGSLRSLRVRDLATVLWTAWVQGGAWDETRAEPEVLRSGVFVRGTTAGSLLRGMLVDALEDLARQEWVTVDLVLGYAGEDPRAAAARRLHERALRERPGVFSGTVDDALRRMLTASLPALGALDVADDASAVRWIERGAARPAPWRARVVGRTLEVPSEVALERVLALADLAEPEGVRPDAAALVFGLGARAAARARARGVGPAMAEAHLRGVGLEGPDAPAVEALLHELAVARDARFARAAGVLVVEDPALRAELRGDPVLRRMLFDLDAGPVLVVRADVDLERVWARLGRLGVRPGEHVVVGDDPRARESGATRVLDGTPETTSGRG